MPPKRPGNSSASASRAKRVKTTRPVRVVRSIRGVPVSNVRTNGAKRLQDVKVIKVPNPRGGRGSFTIVATSAARVGDSGAIGGVVYVVRSEEQLRMLIRERRWAEVQRSCTSRITNMKYLFERHTSFNHPIGHWDTSLVTNMEGMFQQCTKFNQPIGGWNTSSVRNMSEMFHGAYAFNQPIGAWNTSSVTNMENMFDHALAFNQPIGAWNTSSVRYMGSMFNGALRFNKPIGDWNTSSVRYMNNMFRYASAFNQPIGAWNTSSVTDMHWMFCDATAFNKPIGAWNTSSVTDMTGMFYNARAFNQPIGAWNMSSVTRMHKMFQMFWSGGRAFNQDLSAWRRTLRRNFVRMDEETRRLIYGEEDDPLTTAFRRQRYRLHPSANAFDPVLHNRVNLDDARVIAGDVDKNSRLRHIFHRETMDGVVKQGILRHPMTQAVFKKSHIVPLRDVLHANDAKIYNRVGVNRRTVGEVRANMRNGR